MPDTKIPNYRIVALANLDLEQYLKENPRTVDAPGEVEWEVEETDYHYVAKGSIEIPVELYFGKTEGQDGNPEVRRVIIEGKRVFDARLDEGEDPIGGSADESARSQLTHGVDETKVQAENMNRYRKDLRG